MFGLGSSSQLGIGIAIELNDRFSGQAAKVNQQLLAMRKNANAAVAGAIKDYRNQSAAIAAGALAASGAMMSMAKAGAEFDHSINQMYIVGGKSLGRSRKQLSDFAQDMSKVFTRDPAEISKAMFENIYQGVTDGLEEITKYQVAVATATDEPLKEVADNLLSIKNSMDIPTSKFGEIANVITSVANSTQASVASLGESMKYGAFTAHQFNLPLATTVALFGKLSQAGIRGTSAGTAVNQMLTQMAKGLGPFRSKRQTAAWHMMGLDPAQITTMANMGNIQGVISAVSKAADHMTAIDKGSVIATAFNIRGTRAMEGLFDSKNGNKSIASIIQGAQDAVRGDLVMKQSKAMMNDLSSDFKFMTNAFHRFRIAFTHAAAPTLRLVMHVGAKVLGFISGILDTPIGKIFAGIAAVVIPTIGVLFAFRAALFTATIALKEIGGTASIGGFRGLLGAGLNSVGLARFGNKGGNLVKNAAGRYFYPAGSVNAMGEKIGGRLVGKAALSEMGLAGGALAAEEGVGILGSIGGLLGKAVPILGEILMAVSVLKLLGLNFEAKRNQQHTNPLIGEYYRDLDEAYYGKSLKDSSYYNGKSMGNWDKTNKGVGDLSQNIQINIDGKEVMNQSMQNYLGEQLNNAMINLKQ